jgi:microcystin-dependent protein
VAVINGVNVNWEKRFRLVALGFIAMFITTISLTLFSFMRPADSISSPGTCLPIEKGGTGCDDVGLVRYLGQALYPVGTILTTTTSTNPDTIFGGTWAQFGQGRTLLGIGSADANTATTYGNLAAGAINRTTVEEKGGEVSHTLSVAELASHTHGNIPPMNYAATPQAGGTTVAGMSQGSGYTTSGATGSGGAHNNIQPYITVYFWKRTS